MNPRSDTPQQAASPRRDVLGFSKSVVEFFTGMTGLAAASVGVLGTVLTIAFTAGAFETPSSMSQGPTGSTSQDPPGSTPGGSTGSTAGGSTGSTPEDSGSTPDSPGSTSDNLIADIEATIRTDLGDQLAGTGEIVDSVSCERESDTRAHCTATMSGTGPSSYSIGVDIDPTTGLFVWQVDS
jgi:hypothetical protein